MSALDTLRENFAVWHRELAITHELALSQANAMAGLIEKNARGSDFGIGRLRLTLQKILGTNAERYLLTELALTTERLAFLEAFLAASSSLSAEMLPLLGEDVGTASLPLTAPRIATMRAPVTERAREALVTLLPAATPLYCNGFSEVCERLGHGEAELALLPVEDSEEGVLHRVLNLIEHFELHIAATLSIMTPDGKEARLALLYHGKAPLLAAAGDEMLECQLFETGEVTLGELLLVARECGLSLRRVDTRTTGSNPFYHPVFYCKGARLTLFAAYLALFMPRTVITAHYIHLTKESENLS